MANKRKKLGGAFKKGTNGANANNWEILQSRGVADSAQDRDVYSQQQLRRGHEKKIISDRGINLGAIFIFIIVFLFAHFVYSWIASAMAFGNMRFNNTSFGPGESVAYTKVAEDKRPYMMRVQNVDGSYLGYALNEKGEKEGKPYKFLKDIPIPQWYLDLHKGYSEKELRLINIWTLTKHPNYVIIPERGADGKIENPYAFKASFGIGLWKDFFAFGTAAMVTMAAYVIMKKRLEIQNIQADHSDINTHVEDQHIMLVEEMQEKFDWFPDIGAHSKVQPNCLISHVMLNNKGLNAKFDVYQRHEKDVYEGKDLVAYKGDFKLDKNGNYIVKSMPVFDEEFGKELFEVSEVPDVFRITYDTNIPYNPGNKDRDKLKYDKVKDLIENDWTFPYYETQRPTGAYLVDTSSVNNLLVAITRSGKGQTILEPMIDMLTREVNNNNMLINDPKGELLVKFYVRGCIRGFDVVQFNLIYAMKTSVYNPLLLAAEAARAGDKTKCAQYVTNIADVFFPVDGNSDPVWPNSGTFKKIIN